MNQPHFTYADVGATAHRLPDGFRHTHRSQAVGRGKKSFTEAADRLLRWEMHRSAGLTVDSPDREVEEGTLVELTLGRGPIRMTAPCQVVYVIDEPRLRGFAYGTVTGHPETGEERFCVEWRADDSVVFTITAFSRPGRWWSRLAAPFARIVQNRITERYLAVMGSL